MNVIPDGYTFRKFSMKEVHQALINWYECDDCVIDDGYAPHTYIVTLYYLVNDLYPMKTLFRSDNDWMRCSGQMNKTVTIGEGELFGIVKHSIRLRLSENQYSAAFDYI